MLWNDIKLVIAAASLRNDNGIEAKKNSIYYRAFISCSPMSVCLCVCVCRSIFESAFMALINCTVCAYIPPLIGNPIYRCVCNWDCALPKCSHSSVPMLIPAFPFCANKCHFKPFNLIECYNMLLWAHNSSSAVSFRSFYSCSCILTQLTWFNKWYLRELNWRQADTTCVRLCANECVYTAKGREQQPLCTAHIPKDQLN